MIKFTQSQWDKNQSKNIFENLGNWKGYDKHKGKRSALIWDNGTCLIIEGIHFEIV